MHIRPFRGVFPRQHTVKFEDSFFLSVKEQYAEFAKAGMFEQAANEAFYIYQIRTQLRNFTGLVACAKVEDYFEGNIRKHEKTLEAKEKIQLELLLRRQASVKPVLLTYTKVDAIQDWLDDFIAREEPFFEQGFEKGQETHHFWEVSNWEDIKQLSVLFEREVKETYIADGHHRLSAVAHVYEEKGGHTFEQLLCAFFPSTELVILDFNRVIEMPAHISSTHLMARLSEIFEIKALKRATRPRRRHEIIMHIKKEWYSLQWKPFVLEQYADEDVLLDAALLNKKVLEEVLQIEDVRTDQRIKYVEGPKGLRGLQKATKGCKRGVGFCLYPVSFEELAILADQDKMLPPKSTWFEPRMKNGLVVQAF